MFLAACQRIWKRHFLAYARSDSGFRRNDGVSLRELLETLMAMSDGQMEGFIS
jgi:hypothetical protein